MKHYLPPVMQAVAVAVAVLLRRLADVTADGVVAATPTIAETYRNQTAVVVHNYPELSQEGAGVPYLSRPKVVAYVGSLTAARGAVQMVDAMDEANLGDDWSLHLVGPQSPPTLTNALSSRPGWKRVRYQGRVGPVEARRAIDNARIGLLLFHPTAAHLDALPNKLFEYMAGGVPIVASDFKLWRDLLETADCAVFVDPLDVRQVADVIRGLAADPTRAQEMGSRGKAVVERELNWGHEEQVLYDLYRRLIG